MKNYKTFLFMTLLFLGLTRTIANSNSLYLVNENGSLTDATRYVKLPRKPYNKILVYNDKILDSNDIVSSTIMGTIVSDTMRFFGFSSPKVAVRLDLSLKGQKVLEEFTRKNINKKVVVASYNTYFIMSKIRKPFVGRSVYISDRGISNRYCPMRFLGFCLQWDE